MKWIGGAAGVAAGAYAAYVGLTWLRYGHPAQPRGAEEDLLLDSFLPRYDVVERHHVRVHAPAATTLDAARHVDLFNVPLVRAIFKGRELLLGSRPDERPQPRGLLAQVRAIGWEVLAEIPDREIVIGAVTKPWEPDVTFRGVAPGSFAAFAEPDYVKIAWTLRADPVGPSMSIFRSETRALATDPAARARFRVYWSFLSPGITIIRRMSLGPVRRDAERRARETSRSGAVAPLRVAETRVTPPAGTS